MNVPGLGIDLLQMQQIVCESRQAHRVTCATRMAMVIDPDQMEPAGAVDPLENPPAELLQAGAWPVPGWQCASASRVLGEGRVGGLPTGAAESRRHPMRLSMQSNLSRRAPRVAPYVAVRIGLLCFHVVMAGLVFHAGRVLRTEWMPLPSPRCSGFGRAGGTSPFMTAENRQVFVLRLPHWSNRLAASRATCGAPQSRGGGPTSTLDEPRTPAVRPHSSPLNS